MASAAPYTSSPVRPVPTARAVVPPLNNADAFEAVSLDMIAAGALLEAIDGELNDSVMSARGGLLIVALRAVLATANAKMHAAVEDLMRPC